MNSPKPQPPRPSIGFTHLVDDAFKFAADHKQTIAYALNIGVRPNEILSYVRGDLTLHENQEMVSFLCRSPWAMGRVIALVRARRDPKSLGARILAATHTDPYAWGIKNTGDEDADLCLLLDRVE